MLRFPNTITLLTIIAIRVAATTTADCQQTVRLPPTDGVYEDDLYERVEAPPLAASPLPPSKSSSDDFRFLQGISATGTYLGGGGNNGLGIAEFNLKTTLIAPLPIGGGMVPLIVSPSLGVKSLDNSTGVALPNELYNSSISFSLMRDLSPQTKLMLGFSPGIASDLEADSGDAFRLPAFVMITWQKSAYKQWIFGVVYTDRNDIPILPMAGLVLTPNDDTRIELTAPRPRYARRVCWLGDGVGEEWAYIAGEFGGGTYAVQRAPGLEDELTLRDFRLVVGWERKVDQRHSMRLEVGYVFGRSIEYESDNLEVEPSDTYMLRAGLSF